MIGIRDEDEDITPIEDNEGCAMMLLWLFVVWVVGVGMVWVCAKLF